jgi:hypothetical protein
MKCSSLFGLRAEENDSDLMTVDAADATVN